jgi:hypothetical protein
MNGFRKMSKPELRQTVDMLAREAAMKHFQRRNPGCADEAAWAFAEDHWRQFIDVAADVLATLEAMDEAAAAGSN